MTVNSNDNYLQRLQAVINTRLVFNTMPEHEDFLGNHAIHTNGIKRIFNTLPRQRGAYRDLRTEAAVLTAGNVDLDELLSDYEMASRIYNKHFARRADRARIAWQLLDYYFETPNSGNTAPRLRPVFESIINEGTDIAILTLVLLGALPNYNSKDGDVTDIDALWRSVMDFLDSYTRSCSSVTESLAVISRARGEKQKCRLLLIYHTMVALGIHIGYVDTNAIYDTSTHLKRLRVDLDLAGYWNECGGTADDTSFWQIENTADRGVFFCTWWQKLSDNTLRGMRYTLNLLNEDGRLMANLLHPDALKHRIKGLKYTDRDHVFYEAEMPDNKRPLRLDLERTTPSRYWKQSFHLARVTDAKTDAIYDKWLKSCRIVKPHEQGEYEFYYSLWGITHEALYVYDDEREIFYKVPRDGDFGFEKITLNDNVGILTMDGKRYLAFDDMLLYIPLTDTALLRYGITETTEIN